MNIELYIKQKKELQLLLIGYLDSNDDENEVNYRNFEKYLKDHQIYDNINEFRSILYLLSKIAKNHHRSQDFFKKIEQILIFLEKPIKQTFSNSEIFHIFKKNQRILLFLFKQNFITVDKSMVKYFTRKNKNQFFSFKFFFMTEIKSLLDRKSRKRLDKQLLKFDENTLTDFEEKRKIGENDSYICQLIRDDSIEEFIAYTTRTCLSLSNSKIPESIYETNSFLVNNKETTLIEYAAFYGSIQIFQYLRMMEVELKPSLWLYAIHSNNANLIHLLEEYRVEPDDISYEKCLKESIKCHHNEIANYIKANLLKEKNTNNKLKRIFNKGADAASFHYYNYSNFTNNYNQKSFFYYACKYDYFQIVDILLKTSKIDINNTIVFFNIF
ncbi:hypothetical protein M9Y10_007865 [Tritrichomonas musculus]|uniref:DUF3447 domain-containing protein n=1 Tax=Tritrichomonas musculus TaxID=1915356 RepID=A0ABR2J2V7_9EUKA